MNDYIDWDKAISEAKDTVFGSATPALEKTPQEKEFLPMALSWLNRNVSLPTNARIYVESVIDKKKGRITNKDFTPEELDIVRDLIEASSRSHVTKSGFEWGPTPGVVGYEVYSKDLATEPKMLGLPLNAGLNTGMMSVLDSKSRVGTTLGRFVYDIDPETGTVVARDTYNFNPVSGRMSTLRRMGQEQLPEGTGREVELYIPKEKFGEHYSKISEGLTRRRMWNQGLMR